MALTVKIEPILIIDNNAIKLSAYVMNYDLNGGNCQLSWWLSDENNVKIYEGIYSVPQDIIDKWGNDDMIIITSLADAKGFKIIE